MATFSSTLVVTLGIFISIDLAFSQDYEALVVMDNLPSDPDAQLPFRAEEVNNEISYPKTTENGREIEYSYLCPAETPEIVHEVQKLLGDYPEYEYCLEKIPSTTQPLKCSKEVKPILIPHRDKRDKKCPHVSFNFAFIYFKMKKDPSIEESNWEPKMISMRLYDVCFDQRKRWTRHRVATGLMLQGRGLPSQELEPPDDYSKETFKLPWGNYFEEIADNYKNQRTDGTYKMIPEMLVPHEDLALRLWKKSTYHYVNTSPLWENLTPLMKVINDGIRKAGIVVSVATYKPETQQSEHLDIYTTTFSYSYRPQLDVFVKNSKVFPLWQFGLNIWCKFIYHESEHKGMLIFVHNLPNLPPKRIIYKTINSDPIIAYVNTECKFPVSCNFRNWSEEIELPDELLNYAYCCPVDTKKVEEFFDIKLGTKIGLLDMNGLVKKHSPRRIYVFL